MAPGADAFVFKPVTIEEREGALKKALPAGRGRDWSIVAEIPPNRRNQIGC